MEKSHEGKAWPPKVPDHPGYEPLEVPHILGNCVCPVCHEVYSDPVMGGCGHLHCRACMLALPDKRCTLCQQAWRPNKLRDLSATEHLTLRSIISDVQVLCKGCKQKVPRGLKGELFEAHVSACETQCSYCGFLMARIQLQDHYGVCPEIPARCRGCGFKAKQAEVFNHETTCMPAQIDPLKNLIDTLTARVDQLNHQVKVTENAIQSHHFRLAQCEGDNATLLGCNVVTRIRALEINQQGRLLWSSSLPLAKPEVPGSAQGEVVGSPAVPAGQGNETADLHIKFAMPLETADSTFALNFQGHHAALGQPLLFSAVGYALKNEIVQFGGSNPSGSVVVSRAYRSSDGFLCLVVSAGGADWHGSELSMRLANNSGDRWRQEAADLMTVSKIEHRSENF